MYDALINRGNETMKDLLNLINKEVSVIDYFVPSQEDLLFMKELEEIMDKFEKELEW